MGYTQTLSRPILLSDGTLRVTLNMSTVRTSLKGLCQTTEYGAFNSQNCKSTLFIALNVSSSRRRLQDFLVPIGSDLKHVSSGTGQSLLFMNKNFQTYIFTSNSTNLTEKVLFLEQLTVDCKTCSITMDPNLMISLCYDVACTRPLKNNSVRVGTPVYLTVAYSSPVYLYSYDLKDLQVLDNGSPMKLNLVETQVGTVAAFRVKTDYLGEHLTV